MKPLFLAFVLAPACLADVAMQTDWSDGPGTPGPVTAWADDFSCETSISWYETLGSLTLEPGIQGIVGTTGCCRMDPADIDGDGDLDLAASANWTDEILWWQNTGSGATWVRHVVVSSYPGPEGVACADFDGDGDIDVAGSSDSGLFLSWWENMGGGTAWAMHIVTNPGSNVRALDTGDVDGDGDPDLIGCVELSDSVVWWENAGGGASWTEHVVDSVFDGAWDSVGADIDGDGILDIVASAHSFSGPATIAWWDNTNGSGTAWIRNTISPSFTDVRCVTAADLDGDGDLDVAGTSFDTDKVKWWENEGGSGTSWTEHPISSYFPDAHSVTIADCDGDGDMDAFGTSMYPNVVSWWRNIDGTGSLWQAYTLTSSLEEARATACADVDADGRDELFAAGSGSVWMWDRDVYQTPGALESSVLYTNNDPDWGALFWSASTPPGTSLGFQLRASDNPSVMGAWSDTLWVPGSLHGLLPDNTSYFQYRAVLRTTNTAVSPVLHEVTVTWTPLVIAGGDAPAAFELLPVTPNPSNGQPSIEFGLPAPGFVEISVFDVAGRLVQSIPPSEYQPGWHGVQLGELGVGIYFVRARAGEFEATESFVVIE
jgi:hypothetical protein